MLAVRRKPLSAPLLVRRGKPLQPTPRCREAAGIRFRGGDGLRPAGAGEGERSPAVGHDFLNAPHPPQAVPLPLRGEGLNAPQIKVRMRMSGTPLSISRRAKRCRPARRRAGAPIHERRRGEAHRRQGNGCRPPRGSVGWGGGVYPSAPIKARTAASDGQRAFTRACASAPGLILR